MGRPIATTALTAQKHFSNSPLPARAVPTRHRRGLKRPRPRPRGASPHPPKSFAENPQVEALRTQRVKRNSGGGRRRRPGSRPQRWNRRRLPRRGSLATAATASASAGQGGPRGRRREAPTLPPLSLPPPPHPGRAGASTREGSGGGGADPAAERGRARPAGWTPARPGPALTVRAGCRVRLESEVRRGPARRGRQRGQAAPESAAATHRRPGDQCPAQRQPRRHRRHRRRCQGPPRPPRVLKRRGPGRAS